MKIKVKRKDERFKSWLKKFSLSQIQFLELFQRYGYAALFEKLFIIFWMNEKFCFITSDKS